MVCAPTKALEGKGEFDKKRVVSVLEAEQNTLLDANLWIDLMKEFELVFSKKDSDDQFSAPQYLPPTCKDLSEKAFNNLLDRLPQRLVLHYPDFLPRSLIPRFICRYGNLAKDEYWKYGIVFHKNGEEVCVVCDYDKQDIAIRSAARFSTLTLELLETLRNIDDSASLEIAVSEEHDAVQLIGPVPFVKLQEYCSKGREYVEWGSKEFDMRHFKGLFGREKEPERTAKKAFFSYSKHDRAYLESFLKHLAALRRNGKIEAWDDSKLKGGEEWDAAIKQNLKEADIIFLLISPDFLDTDYVWDVEIKTAMERHERREAIVVPIVLRHCDWTDLAFGKLNALPSKGTPVSSYADKDVAWLEVVNRIKALLP